MKNSLYLIIGLIALFALPILFNGAGPPGNEAAAEVPALTASIDGYSANEVTGQTDHQLNIIVSGQVESYRIPAEATLPDKINLSTLAPGNPYGISRIPATLMLKNDLSIGYSDPAITPIREKLRYLTHKE